MTTTSQILTIDDVWNLPDHGGRSELVNGELRTMPPAGPEHGMIANQLAALLTVHVLKNKLGKVFAAETGFILKKGPDTLRAPDGAFVSRARIPASGVPKKFWQIAPDLVIEVMSPTDVLSELEEKIDDWINAGVRMVWVVSPTRKTVTIYSGTLTPKVVGPADQLAGEDVVPGFSITVAEIFE